MAGVGALESERRGEVEGERWGAAGGATEACHGGLQEGSSTRGSFIRYVLWLLA
jgi:hypothetical protein